MDSDNTGSQDATHEAGFEFTGKAGEYFSIWIVNIALTILTLGIYSAWAKVRTNQYFYGNTYLDGASFRYLADPRQILKGRAIAFVAFVIYYFSSLTSPLAGAVAFFLLMLLVPAFIVMSMSFRLRNSSYRNVRYRFEKNYRRAYTLFMLPILLIGAYVFIIGQLGALQADQAATAAPPKTLIIAMPVLVLLIMAMFPWWDFLVTRFKVRHAAYGDANFAFSARGKHYYGLYLKLILIGLIGGVLVAITLSAVVGGLTAAKAGQPMPVYLPFVMMLLVMPFYLWMGAYFQTLRTNLIFSNIKIGGHQLQSRLKVGYMTWLYFSNTLAILLSLGLLVPWARVRTARYKASVTTLLLDGDLASFASVQAGNQSALGEEMGEVFDMDLGL